MLNIISVITKQKCILPKQKITTIILVILKGTYLDTIQPTDYGKNKRRPEIGQRLRLSEGDIAQTNLLYKCQRKSTFLYDFIILKTNKIDFILLSFIM